MLPRGVHIRVHMHVHDAAACMVMQVAYLLACGACVLVVFEVTTVFYTEAVMQTIYLLAGCACVLATKHKGSCSPINALSPGPPIAAQAGQREHHLLLVSHGSMMHGSACMKEPLPITAMSEL